MYEERTKFKAEVRDVFSGDDLVLLIDLGVDDLYKRKRVRLHGVDTPNAVKSRPDTEAGQVRSLVFEMLKRRKLVVTVVSSTHNSWVSIVEIVDGSTTTNLNDVLIAKGYKFNNDKGSQ